MTCLARLERGYRDFAVRAVGRQNEHRVDTFVLQQLAVIGIYLILGFAVIGAGFNRPFLDQIAERDHLRRGISLFRRHVLAVGDTAAADNADPYFVHVSFLLVFYAARAETPRRSVSQLLHVFKTAAEIFLLAAGEFLHL